METIATKTEASVIIVSGLPRSGTSMLMAMLEAGGVPIYSDGVRVADADNPKGYFELERVKSLRDQKDKDWVHDAKGHALKVVSPLVVELPKDLAYSVIFMNRDLDEVIASQDKMRSRRGDDAATNAHELRASFASHLVQVKRWIAKHANYRLLELNHRDVVSEPRGAAEKIRDFLTMKMDIANMTAVVDRRLYRNRR